MKPKIFISGLIFLVVCFAASQDEVYGQPTNDAPFDVFRGDLTWREHTAHLDNFAYYMLKDPNVKGCIAYYSSDKVSRKFMAKRIARSIAYLRKTFEISESRLIGVYRGASAESKVVLQPFIKVNSPKPSDPVCVADS